MPIYFIYTISKFLEIINHPFDNLNHICARVPPCRGEEKRRYGTNYLSLSITYICSFLLQNRNKTNLNNYNQDVRNRT